MTKYYGIIGFSETKESTPGVWTEVITEKNYFGDVVKDARRYSPSESVNDNVLVNNRISIISDMYAYQNFSYIKYIVYMGVKWSITNIEITRPRLILTLGDMYNA